MYGGGDGDYLDSYGELDGALDGGGLGYDSLDSGELGLGLGGGYDSFDNGYGGYDSYGGGIGIGGELGELGAMEGYEVGFGSTQPGYSYGGQLGGGVYDASYRGLDGLGGEGYLEEAALMESGLSLVHAWGDDLGGWRDDQYALGDLMYYQNSLANERSLDEAERLSRWEERLRWEALSEAQRRQSYTRMNPSTLHRLGLHSGYWGQQYGQRPADLSYLRRTNFNLSSPFRRAFSSYGVGRRYSPYFGRNYVRSGLLGSGVGGRRLGAGIGGGGLGLGGTRVGTYGASWGAGRRELPHSIPLNTGNNIRIQDMRQRLALAESRSRLTSLPPLQRAAALEQARQIRLQINQEIGLNDRLDGVMRRENLAEVGRGARAGMPGGYGVGAGGFGRGANLGGAY